MSSWPACQDRRLRLGAHANDGATRLPGRADQAAVQAAFGQSALAAQGDIDIHGWLVAPITNTPSLSARPSISDSSWLTVPRAALLRGVAALLAEAVDPSLGRSRTEHVGGRRRRARECCARSGRCTCQAHPQATPPRTVVSFRPRVRARWRCLAATRRPIERASPPR